MKYNMKDGSSEMMIPTQLWHLYMQHDGVQGIKPHVSSSQTGVNFSG